MKTWFAGITAVVVLLLAPVLTGSAVHAQTTDPAKIEEFKARFAKGKELFEAGQADEALKVFQGILADEPKAPGSLFFCAFITLHQGNYEEAATYADRFMAVAPKDFKGIVLAIQANQALKRTAKVEALRKTLFELRDEIKPTPGLTDTRSMYIRERIKNADGRYIIVGEYFDYKTEPFVVYLAEQVDSQNKPVRRLVLSYNADAAKQGKENYSLSEYVIVNGQIKQINIYKEYESRPDYDTCRKAMLDIIKDPPKPLHSAPVNNMPAERQ